MYRVRFILTGLAIILMHQIAMSQQLKLGNNPFTVQKSALLDMESPNQGLLLARINDTTLINSLTPPDGMIIYFIPTKQLMVRSNSIWQPITSGAIDTTNISNFYLKVRGLLSAGTGISYNNTTGVITNSAPDQTVALTSGTGISATGTYPNFTIANTAPDQTVALTAGTGIGVSGTYPNFTITNNSPSSGGTVTSVTSANTDASVANTTTTPVITINSAPKLTTARTIQGVSFDGTTNINPINGTGFVKASGTTLSYDNSTYLTSVDTGNISNFYLKVRGLHSSTAPITYSTTTGIIGITQATTSTNGYLSSTDWNTFNGKGTVSSIGLTSSDITVGGSGSPITTSGTYTLTLPTINSNVGTFNNVTVNGKGQVTAASNVAYLTGNQTITLSGDVSGSGATAITTTLANSGVTAGTYGRVTVNAKGLVTAGKRQETYSGTTNASGVYSVTFGTPYSVAPNIQANIVGGTANQIITMTVSTTGFTCTVVQRNSVTLLTIEVLLAATVPVNGGSVDVLITEK